MDTKSLISDIEKSVPYQKWREQTEQKSFLASLFASVEDEKPINWHVNYYTPGLENATTFTVLPNVSRLEDSPMSGEEPRPLNITGPTSTFPEILEIATELMNKEYAKYSFSKVLATLHQENAPVWNLNFLTSQGKAVLVQIAAKDASIIAHKELSISDFTQRT